VFKIRIRSDFEKSKREDPESGSRRTLNLQDPEQNENDTLDPNPHQTKMSDHDPLPS
jgi:hypothetical protein